MAIKPIDEIPESESQKRRSYRAKVREDLQKAIDQGITRFEFEGDYNYKYLAQYAREEADLLWRKAYRDEMVMQLHSYAIDKTNISRFPDYSLKGNYIKIYTRKMHDRIHIYCEIDDTYPKKTCTEIVNRYVERMRKAEDIITRRDITASISDIGLSFRAEACLLRAEYSCVGELEGKTIRDLLKIRNIVPKSAQEIIEKMKLFYGEKENGDKDKS